MMRQRTLLGLACLNAMLASLTGCAGKTRYPNYYVLNLPAPPVPGAAQSKPLLSSVAVRELRAPAFLRAGPIVYRKSAEQIDYYDYHRWAVDPRSAVTSTIIEKMRVQGIFHSVHLFDGREPSDYLVTGTLDDLEEVDKDCQVFVQVRVSARLTDLRTGGVLWSDTSSETTKLEDHAVPGLVAAISQTAESVVTRLVSSMQHQLSTASGSLVRTQPGQP